MQSSQLRDMMEAALKSGSPDENLRRSITASPAVAAEWRRQHFVHAILEADPLVDPPLDFKLRVMQRLSSEQKCRPAWQIGLLQVSLLMAGTLGFSWTAVSLSRHWQLADIGPHFWTMVTALVFALVVAVDASIHAATGGSLVGLLGLVVAFGAAVAWFGALVMPRMARPGARSH